MVLGVRNCSFFLIFIFSAPFLQETGRDNEQQRSLRASLSACWLHPKEIWDPEKNHLGDEKPDWCKEPHPTGTTGGGQFEEGGPQQERGHETPWVPAAPTPGTLGKKRAHRADKGQTRLRCHLQFVGRIRFLSDWRGDCLFFM